MSEKCLTIKQILKISKWIKRLWAKQDSQIRHYLHTDYGYCCLGVGAEVLHGSLCWKRTIYAYYFYNTLETTTTSLSGNDAEQLGISEFQETLIEMNDRGDSFKQIARRLVDFYKETWNVDFSEILK